MRYTSVTLLISILLALFSYGCTTVSPFSLSVQGLRSSAGTLSFHAPLPDPTFRISVTGRGLEQTGALNTEEFQIFTSSLKTSVQESGLFRSTAESPELVTPFLHLELLHHVMAGTSGGIMDVAYLIQTDAGPKKGRKIAFCPSTITRSVKDCLNRAIVYSLLLELDAANGGKNATPESYEDALFFNKLSDAVAKLPTKLVYVECLMWVTTTTGQECRMNKAHTLDPVPWSSLIKENDGMQQIPPLLPF